MKKPQNPQRKNNAIECDFLVIGSGIAGLYYALHASEIGNVIIVTKDKVTEGATGLAQGGVAASLSPSDSWKKHYEDTLIAGAGLCDHEAVQILVSEGIDRMNELIQMGMPFTKDAQGELDLGMEGGHSEKRILHAADHTGADLHRFISGLIRQKSNITILENHFAIDIITEHHLKAGSSAKTAYGAYVMDPDKNILTFQAKTTVIATGGAGRVYRFSTNPPVATGDGIAMGYRAGCRVRNLEFTQFHPTALYSDSEQTFLISEALRGHGAKLVRENGETFMEEYDERKELAPRDVVARAIDSELKKSNSKCVYLDVTHLDPEETKQKFPLIYNTLLENHNIDMTKEKIPVVPAAHYTCGGILTDINGKTDLDHLYAVGETASTGVHGANRLASNSLLEAVVFSYRAVQNASLEAPPPASEIPVWKHTGTENFQELGIIKHRREEIGNMMWHYIGIIRSEARLNRALKIIDIIYGEVRDMYQNSNLNREILELRNLTLIAQLIIRSALMRKESRGLHYMSDYAENREASREDTILEPSVRYSRF